MVNITLTPNATGYASNLTVVQKNFNHKADISLSSTYIIFATCGGVFILCILLTIIIKVRRSQQRRQTSKDHETAMNITQTKVVHENQQTAINHEYENDLEKIAYTNRNIKGKLPVNTEEPVNKEEPQYEISVIYEDTEYYNIPADESNELTQNCRQTSRIGRYYESLRRFTPFGKSRQSNDSPKYASVKLNMFFKSKKRKVSDHVYMPPKANAFDTCYTDMNNPNEKGMFLKSKNKKFEKHVYMPPRSNTFDTVYTDMKSTKDEEYVSIKEKSRYSGYTEVDEGDINKDEYTLLQSLISESADYEVVPEDLNINSERDENSYMKFDQYVSNQ